MRNYLRRLSRLWTSRARSEGQQLHDPTIGLMGAADDDPIALRLGPDVYREIVADDAEIASALRKLVAGCAAKPFTVEPGGETRRDRTIAEATDAMLRSIGLRNPAAFQTPFGFHYELLSNALTDGLAFGELIFRRDAKLWTIDYVAFARPEDYDFRQSDTGLLTGVSSLTAGGDLDMGSLLIAPWLPFYSRIRGARFLRAAYRWHRLKSETRKAAALYAQRAASGIVIGRYPAAGWTAEMRNRLLTMVKRLTAQSATILREDAKIEALKADVGPSEIYARIIDLCDRQIRKLILGSTLGTDVSSSGSRAVAQVHKDVQDEMIAMLAAFEAETINEQIIRPFVAANFATTRYPRFRRQLKPADDPGKMSEVCVRVWNMGGAIPADWVRDTLRVPIDGDEPLRKSPGDGELPDGIGILSERFSSERFAERANIIREQATYRRRADDESRRVANAQIPRLRALVEWARAGGGDALPADVIDAMRSDIIAGAWRAMRLGVDAVAARSRGAIRLAEADWPYDQFVPRSAMDEIANLMGEQYWDDIGDLFWGAYQDALAAGLANGWTAEQTADSFARKIGIDPRMPTSAPEFNWRMRRLTRTAYADAFTRAKWESSKRSLWVAGYLYSAVLDARTTPFCEEHDGLYFTREAAATVAPPNHWHCRSDLIPVWADEAGRFTDPAALSTRPDPGFEEALPL